MSEPVNTVAAKMNPASKVELRGSVFGGPAVDCDVHISVPSTKVLMPYLDPYWRASFELRGLERTSFAMTSDPANAPINARPDWTPKAGRAGTDLGLLQSGAIEGFRSTFAIANCIWGGPAMASEDMSAAACRAANDWIAAQWLDREPRLRASIMVPMGNPELAAEEIERRAGDPRFVQVSLLAATIAPLGKRSFWPIYRAAEKHGLPIGIHAGSTYDHAPTTGGWGSYFIEDYVAQAAAFESQTLSLVSEGVFSKFPELKVVFIESGVTWLPACLWRFDKTWRGTRAETPWLTRAPSEIVRDHIRLTVQPFDAPDGAARLERYVEQIGSDRTLLFSSDFPHWHYEGLDALPVADTSPLAARILFDNPIETYGRLAQTLVQKEPAQ